MAIDRLTRSRTFGAVLDLGCGSGVLAIAAAKAMPGARIIAADMDPKAVSVATENVRLNGVSGQITLVVAAGVAHAAPFDLLIANILVGPLIQLAPTLARSVKAGGTLVLSGILISQAAEVIATYRSHGFTLLRHDRLAGWSILTLRQR